MSKTAASEDEETFSDEDDVDSDDENLDPLTDLSDKDADNKSTDADGKFCVPLKFFSRVKAGFPVRPRYRHK